MLSRLLLSLVLLFLSLPAATYFVQAQDGSSEAPNPWITQPCDDRPDEEIFRKPTETGHGVDQGLVDLIHGFGNLLLLLWWLFAAGLLRLVIALFRKTVAVWVVIWLPFLLVGWVALAPLQELRQKLRWVEEFQAQCRAYDPPSRALLAYKQRKWNEAFPYISMVVAMTMLYVPAIGHVVKYQKQPPLL
ncbi:hypothetical protein KB206_11285 [Microvirga sp. STS02]|uniref:hypothetical protein n=1 Tax=Hymenobacter negativus TaxID=2795026 RepID=UPI0018DD9024|nr:MULTISPECIES: hypothetical protein [Bacteria]MBH8569469.1 hypothetical protein [Hymenobacter negativus]MBR7209205.1 hypothetical protein [Microvirga sp. STS02]